MIEQVDHINIVVTDLERSVAFYGLLGLAEDRKAHLEGAWIESVVGLAGVVADVVYMQPPAGGPRIELIQYHAPTSADLPESALPHTVGLRHIAFRVQDIAAVHARLAEAGADIIGTPVQVPGGVIRHYEGEKWLCYFRDPDGVVLELAEYR